MKLIVCGRFTLYYDGDLAEYYEVPTESFLVSPNYNIAPGMNVPVIVQKDKRQIKPMRWGLVPFWADDESIGYKMINARAESVFEKPSFRKPIRSGRCIIPASGFYEWKKEEWGKQPYYFKPTDDMLYSFAGVSDEWQSPDGTALQTFSILTTDANDTVKTVHSRMSVIIPNSDIEVWLDNKRSEAEIGSLLKPYVGNMNVYPVSTQVNNADINSTDCVAPIIFEEVSEGKP